MLIKRYIARVRDPRTRAVKSLVLTLTEQRQFPGLVVVRRCFSSITEAKQWLATKTTPSV